MADDDFLAFRRSPVSWANPPFAAPRFSAVSASPERAPNDIAETLRSAIS